MSLRRRISAGGITFKGNAVLMVRYCDRENGETYLVAPGGALEDDENVVQAAVRETREETGVTVEPVRVLAIEDLVDADVKMIKVWLLCQVIEGEVRKTDEAAREGIIETGWFDRDQLAGETVYPSIILEHDWEELRSADWQVVCLPSRRADSRL